jgi:ankyrin repeat protein
MKFLVDGIRENTLTLPRRAIVAAIFFDFRYISTQDRANARGLLFRELLYQILENDPSILSGLRHSLSSITPFPERPEDLDDRHYERCLHAALITASANAMVFIVIDALDECTPTVQDDVMACIRSIFRAEDLLTRVRVIVTSRCEGTTRQLLEDYPTKLIYMEEENGRAIQEYCSHLLSTQLFGPSNMTSRHYSTLWTDTRESIRTLVNDITHRANGTFLWIRLAIDMLANEFSTTQALPQNMEVWHQAIQDIPTELDSLYESMVKRIPPDLENTFRSVVAWCMFATRPLTVDELHSALKHERQRSNYVCMDRLCLRGTPHLNTIGHGFLEVVYNPQSHSHQVQFIHMTAKDFLLGNGARHVLPSGPAHTVISDVCYDILSISAKPAKEDPLLDYSVSYWAYHAEAGDTLGIPQKHLLDVFERPDMEYVGLEWTSNYRDRYEASLPRSSKRVSVLHVAAKYGLRNTLLEWSAQKWDAISWNQLDDAGATALHHATEGGHVSTVLALLSFGADIHVVNHEKRTPLHLAAKYGHTNVVQLLLDQGSDVGSLDVGRATALHYAATRGKIDTVELLLERGANPNDLDAHGNSMFTLATSGGNEAVAKLALNLKDTKWSSASVGLALVFAAALGLTSLVYPLLLPGRCIDPTDTFVQQALVAAVVRAHEKIARILIEFGCHPDVHDYQHGQSALSVAAASGNEYLVMLLLNNGANPNIRDIHTGSTPVMYAINHGHPVIVDMLLQYGAHLGEPILPCTSGKDSWVFRIVSYLIKDCPTRGKSSKNKGQSSCGDKLGLDPHSSGRGSKQSSGAGRKRGRMERSPDDDGEESQDELKGGGKRTRKTDQSPCACPFQKMFPYQHDCRPKANINRLK